MDGFPPIAFPSMRLRFRTTQPKQREISGVAAGTPVSFVPMAAISETGFMAVEDTKILEDVSAGYTFFRNGDVVIAKITPCFENGKGAIARNLVNDIGFGTTELFVLRPSAEIDERFLYYFTASDYFRRTGIGLMYGAGGQKRIPNSLILDIPFPVIPRHEQKNIADFLDRETAEADALVAKYERLIELLEEKRIALVTQAVTKGLEPRVPVKDSGFEWIGHVPTHWRVLPLRRIAKSVETGGTPPETEFAPDGVPWYTPGDFNLEIDLSETERHVSYSTVSINTYPKGSVLLVGIGATLGKVGLPPGESSSNQQCNAIIPYDDVAPRFLAYALVACYDEMRSRASASTLPILNQSKTKGLELPIAPRAEQEAIATWIDYKMADISSLTEKTKYAISLVKEHRSALITAAVTGQIDVTTYRSKRQMVEAFA